MAENEYTAKKVILKNNQGEYLIPYVEFPIATETSAGIVQPDNSTISVNNGTITAEGIKTKNAVLKYDWIGTKAEWEAGRENGTILDEWVCYITDDFVQTDTSGTRNYNELENKPTIGGIELKGNKELGELGIQSKLTAGENITISEEGVISAISNSSSELPTDVYTKTNLVAGTNIEIVNPTSDDSKHIINNTLSNLSQLKNDTGFVTDEVLETKQDKLTAGNGITIENNVISSTAAGGSSTFEMDYDETTKTLIFSNGDL